MSVVVKALRSFYSQPLVLGGVVTNTMQASALPQPGTAPAQGHSPQKRKRGITDHSVFVDAGAADLTVDSSVRTSSGAIVQNVWEVLKRFVYSLPTIGGVPKR